MFSFVSLSNDIKLSIDKINVKLKFYTNFLKEIGLIEDENEKVCEQLFNNINDDTYRNPSKELTDEENILQAIIFVILYTNSTKHMTDKESRYKNLLIHMNKQYEKYLKHIFQLLKRKETLLGYRLTEQYYQKSCKGLIDILIPLNDIIQQKFLKNYKEHTTFLINVTYDCLDILYENVWFQKEQQQQLTKDTNDIEITTNGFDIVEKGQFYDWLFRALMTHCQGINQKTKDNSHSQYNYFWKVIWTKLKNANLLPITKDDIDNIIETFTFKISNIYMSALEDLQQQHEEETENTIQTDIDINDFFKINCFKKHLLQLLTQTFQIPHETANKIHEIKIILSYDKFIKSFDKDIQHIQRQEKIQNFDPKVFINEFNLFPLEENMCMTGIINKIQLTNPIKSQHVYQRQSLIKTVTNYYNKIKNHMILLKLYFSFNNYINIKDDFNAQLNNYIQFLLNNGFSGHFIMKFGNELISQYSKYGLEYKEVILNAFKYIFKYDEDNGFDNILNETPLYKLFQTNLQTYQKYQLQQYEFHGSSILNIQQHQKELKKIFVSVAEYNQVFTDFVSTFLEHIVTDRIKQIHTNRFETLYEIILKHSNTLKEYNDFKTLCEKIGLTKPNEQFKNDIQEELYSMIEFQLNDKVTKRFENIYYKNNIQPFFNIAFSLISNHAFVLKFLTNSEDQHEHEHKIDKNVQQTEYCSYLYEKNKIKPINSLQKVIDFLHKNRNEFALNLLTEDQYKTLYATRISKHIKRECGNQYDILQEMENPFFENDTYKIYNEACLNLFMFYILSISTEEKIIFKNQTSQSNSGYYGQKNSFITTFTSPILTNLSKYQNFVLNTQIIHEINGKSSVHISDMLQTARINSSYTNADNFSPIRPYSGKLIQQKNNKTDIKQQRHGYFHIQQFINYYMYDDFEKETQHNKKTIIKYANHINKIQKIYTFNETLINLIQIQMIHYCHSLFVMNTINVSQRARHSQKNISEAMNTLLECQKIFQHNQQLVKYYIFDFSPLLNYHSAIYNSTKIFPETPLMKKKEFQETPTIHTL